MRLRHGVHNLRNTYEYVTLAFPKETQLCRSYKATFFWTLVHDSIVRSPLSLGGADSNLGLSS